MENEPKTRNFRELKEVSEPPSPRDSDAAMEFSLLDQATPNLPAIGPDLALQAKVSSDRSIAREDRLEAYEDIFESEVGDTPMTRARNVERETGLRQIYLKFEGGNPTGTQKDRIAFAQCMDALRRGFDAVTVATCGNFGAAMALSASLAGLRCIIYIPDGYHTGRIREMLAYNAEILRVPGSYEDAVRISRERAAAQDIYDANPGGSNVDIQLRAYGEIAYEIYDELRDAPAAVAVPVSNGTTLAGIHRGFVSLYRRGKTSRMPRFFAGSSYRKNPIVYAFRKNLLQCWDLKPTLIRETHINEPLINWHSIDGDLALEALRQTNGFAADASDKIMLNNARMLREREGLTVLPASTAGLAAFLERAQHEKFPGDRYVAILTGRKS